MLVTDERYELLIANEQLNASVEEYARVRASTIGLAALNELVWLVMLQACEDLELELARQAEQAHACMLRRLTAASLTSGPN